jgi:predicted enzyme related to lactoylglutathione lyase
VTSLPRRAPRRQTDDNRAASEGHVASVADQRNAPVNALGYLRVVFAVDDLDETLENLRERGAQLTGEIVQYKDAYRLCYIRGAGGLLIGLAQELS